MDAPLGTISIQCLLFLEELEIYKAEEWKISDILKSDVNVMLKHKECGLMK